MFQVRADVTAVFNWSDPTTLNPAYTGPTASNRYGQYIGNVLFTDNSVSLLINDDEVADANHKARFLFGYNTQMIEMRAYEDSDIIITAPDGMCVHQVTFEGAKADENYMISYDDASSFTDGSWTAGSDAQEAKFLVCATINCTKITVYCTERTGVDDIVAESASPASARWYTIDGRYLSKQPTASGVYVKCIGNTAKTIFIR
jgi:hypothetical protein